MSTEWDEKEEIIPMTSKRNSEENKNNPAPWNTWEKEVLQESNAPTAPKTSTMTKKEAPTPLRDRDTTTREMAPSMVLLCVPRPAPQRQKLQFTTTKKRGNHIRKRDWTLKATHRGRWPYRSIDKVRNLTKVRRTLTLYWTSTIDLKLNKDESRKPKTKNLNWAINTKWINQVNNI